VIKCDWCNQPLANWVPIFTSKVQANEIVLTKELYDDLFRHAWERGEIDKPYHPDCFEYGKHLIELGWTPTVGYEDTPEMRKRMREQFRKEEI